MVDDTDYEDEYNVDQFVDVQDDEAKEFVYCASSVLGLGKLPYTEFCAVTVVRHRFGASMVNSIHVNALH